MNSMNDLFPLRLVHKNESHRGKVKFNAYFWIRPVTAVCLKINGTGRIFVKVIAKSLSGMGVASTRQLPPLVFFVYVSKFIDTGIMKS